jgi:ABC-type sugar transport system substrate-binding protein
MAHKKREWAAVILLFAAAVCFTGCKSREKDKDKIVIGVSFDSLISPVWVANLDAINRMAAQYGAEVVTMMAENDAAKQNQQIENLLAQGVDAIICGPKDSGAIISSVRKCKEAGVPIIMDNRSVSGGILPDAQVVADNRAMAQAELEAFGELARAEGKSYKAILLIGSLADENAGLRKQGHDTAIAKYSDVYKVVAEVPSDWNLDVALKGLQNALQVNPDVDMIITPSDFLWPSIRSSLEQIGKWGKRGDPNHVVVLSFDGDEVGLQYLKDEYSEADAVQNMVLEGELCVEWAIKLINGEKPASNILYDPGIILTYANFAEKAPDAWSYSLLK